MNNTNGGSSSNRARLITMIGGGVVIGALAVFGAVLAFGGSSREQAAPVVTQAAQSEKPVVSTAKPTVKPTVKDAKAAPAQTAKTAAATTKVSPDTASTAESQPAQSTGNGASQASTNGISKYAAEYQIPVGSSPVNTRALHPVDLYTPHPDPAFDITKRTELPPIDNENDFVKWMLAHTNQQEKFLRERWHRATLAVERHHITHKRILMAFLLTPREWFARPYNLSKVYENTALPIGYGQTISGPDLVARMTDYLDPLANQKVLEIGTGSGYQSAFLSSLSNHVYTIEIVKPLAEETNGIYLKHTKEMPQFGNIHRRMADGYYGWPEYAPFDKIIVTTGTDHIPPDLLKELKPGGVMIIPIGPPTGQTIMKITKEVDKDGTVHLTREDIYHGTAKDIFVPFTAAGGGTHFRNKNE